MQEQHPQIFRRQRLRARLLQFARFERQRLRQWSGWWIPIKRTQRQGRIISHKEQTFNIKNCLTEGAIDLLLGFADLFKHTVNRMQIRRIHRSWELDERSISLSTRPTCMLRWKLIHLPWKTRTKVIEILDGWNKVRWMPGSSRQCACLFHLIPSAHPSQRVHSTVPVIIIHKGNTKSFSIETLIESNIGIPSKADLLNELHFNQWHPYNRIQFIDIFNARFFSRL